MQNLSVQNVYLAIEACDTTTKKKYLIEGDK